MHMRKKIKDKNNKFEIIIRPKCNIRSRQWWAKKLALVSKSLLKQLPTKPRKLFRVSGISLLITNNKEILYLNKKYRKINKPTDVLSFHLNKKEQIKNKYLGDIIISIETAQKQALIEKKTWILNY